MRRILCAILTGALLLTALSGCTGREQPSEPVQESPSTPVSLSVEDHSTRRFCGSWAPGTPMTVG